MSCSGPVRELRCRLAEFLRIDAMERFELQQDAQACVPAGVLNTGLDPPKFPVDDSAQYAGGISQTPLLVDLLKQSRHCYQNDPRIFCVSLSGWEKYLCRV